jgi:catechol 2,3-dioxygenase
MYLINSLGYVVFETPNLKEMTDYYHKGLKMIILKNSPEAGVFLGVNGLEPCLILREASEARLREVGFYVGREQDLEQIKLNLRIQAIPYREEELPYFGTTLMFSDCDGHPLQIHLGEGQDNGTKGYPFGPSLSRLHHVTYASPNPQAIADFYQKVLQFKISDMVEEGLFIWLRTNQEHHTIAVAVHKKPGLDHYAFELPDWSSFKAWCDHLAAQAIEIIWGPGRHGPGNNLFFFTLDPDGNRVEYSAEIELFQDDYMVYTPRVWKKSPKSVNLWGPGAPWPRELP